MHLDPLGSIRMRSEAFGKTIKKIKNFGQEKNRFLYFFTGFGGSGPFWMSKTASACNFASDTPIMTSVRSLGLPKRSRTRP